MKRYNPAIMALKHKGDLFAGMRKRDDGSYVLYDEAIKAIQAERDACANECRNWWKAEDCEKAILARNVTPKI